MESLSDEPRFSRLENKQLHEIIKLLREINAKLTPPQPEPSDKTVPIARGAVARSRKKKDAQP